MEKKTENSWLLALLFFLLYQAALVCVLWQKADPRLTLSLMGAGALLLLSRIPGKYFPPLCRQLLQLLIASAGLYWFQFRMQAVSPDLALVELGAVFCAALLPGSLRGHLIMTVLAMILAGFGSFYPGREIYLPCFTAAALLSVMILYRTRTSALAAIPGAAAPPAGGRVNWLCRCVHLLLVLLLCGFLLIRVPLRDGFRSLGIVPVSFHTEQNLEFPRMWGNWFAPVKKMITTDKTEEAVDGNSNPTVSDDKSQFLTNKTNVSVLSSREGRGGASAPGKDLVFRAYSPAKLYWNVQIYDTYDGNQWTRSRMLQKGSGFLDKFKPAEEVEVVQHISIEKPASLLLPHVFRGRSVILTDLDSSAAGGGIAYQKDAFTFALRNKSIPEPPWQYRVQSTLPAPSLNPLPELSNAKPANRGWNYRHLPDSAVSPRLRQLAEELTAGLTTPGEKADALRNFLRNNFKYDLEAPEIPENTEIVDYFLFETKRGYCMHFAQALTVLARLAGLHSRLVTGYSPGKYNALANCFEVYEYHTHAWTQIFIPPYGWLTYDGVPTAELRLEDKAVILKSILDPFGDKWNAKPPEFSLKQPKLPEDEKSSQENNSSPTTESAEKEPGIYSEIYEKTKEDYMVEHPNAVQLANSAFKLLMDKVKQDFASKKNGLMTAFRNDLDRAAAFCRSFGKKLAALSTGAVTAAAVSIGSCAYLIHSRRKILNKLKRWNKRRKCRKLWKKIKYSDISPAERIILCQSLITQQLELAQVHCPPLADVAEKPGLFPKSSLFLTDDCMAVATAAQKVWYSSIQPDEDDAAKAVLATQNFLDKIQRR